MKKILSFWKKKHWYGDKEFDRYSQVQHHIGIRFIKYIAIIFRLNVSVGECGVYAWKETPGEHFEN